MPYIGRFAPSPTGPLHLGSLVAAVASYLHAREANGRWLVRVEDIDPPREVPGAAEAILRTLESLELEWDGAIVHQSMRLAQYDAAAFALVDAGFAYWCTCSRAMLRAHGAGAGYPGTCRACRARVPDAAIRVRVEGAWPAFDDGVCGHVVPHSPTLFGDFVIRRRDQWPAYHLAVTVDDAWQGITTVVRGADLLDSVPPQKYLQRLLALPSVEYFHVPVVVNREGQKLSKQTGAVGVDVATPAAASRTAIEVLRRLGAAPPDEARGARPAELWAWAAGNWRIESLRGIGPLPAGA